MSVCVPLKKKKLSEEGGPSGARSVVHVFSHAHKREENNNHHVGVKSVQWLYPLFVNSLPVRAPHIKIEWLIDRGGEGEES